MSGRLYRSAVVVLLILSFGGIAVHAYLLDETPSPRDDCPFCHWLHNLVEAATPAVVTAVAILLERLAPEIPSDICVQAHRGPFSARSPPAA